LICWFAGTGNATSLQSSISVQRKKIEIHTKGVEMERTFFALSGICFSKLKILQNTVLGILVCLLLTGNVWALDNITIDDNRSGGNWTYSGVDYKGINIGNEDQEVEPNMVTNQVWDLEGFFQEGSMLSMVGGFDYKNGVDHGGHNYGSGDIFISVGDAPTYGIEGATLNNGYEYAIDLDFNTSTYKVYGLDAGSVLKDVIENQNTPESSPWAFEHTNEDLLAEGTFLYEAGLSDGDTGFKGGTHYSLSGFDLGFLGANADFFAHFTMECGNDNLMGQGTTPVPEPATMLLLGVGVMGLGVLNRKRLSR
jgi:hypothetical protein